MNHAVDDTASQPWLGTPPAPRHLRALAPRHRFTCSFLAWRAQRQARKPLLAAGGGLVPRCCATLVPYPTVTPPPQHTSDPKALRLAHGGVCVGLAPNWMRLRFEGGMEADLGKPIRQGIPSWMGGTGGCTSCTGRGQRESRGGSQQKLASHTPSSSSGEDEGCQPNRNRHCRLQLLQRNSSIDSTICSFPPPLSGDTFVGDQRERIRPLLLLLQLSLQRLVDGRPLVSRSCSCVDLQVCFPPSSLVAREISPDRPTTALHCMTL
jgi:hypothetical protein